jgi:hypothetical protein
MVISASRPEVRMADDGGDTPDASLLDRFGPTVAAKPTRGDMGDVPLQLATELAAVAFRLDATRGVAP